MTRQESLDNLITATGRELAVIPVPGTSMFRIGFKDGKGGQLPESICGWYTSSHETERVARAFINRTFDIAEEHNTSRKTKVA